MKQRWIACIATISALALLVGCTVAAPGAEHEADEATPTAEATTTPPTAQPATPAPPSEAGQAAAAASNDFSFDLLQQLRSSAPGDNIFISPVSLALMLQMAYNGADGTTAEEMAQVLHVEGMETAAVNEASRQLQESLTTAADVELLIANSVWVQQGYTLLDSFLETANRYFNAAAATLDFGAPEAVERINTWVSEGTQGKIDQLFETLDANTVAYLINTVYFKGAWSKPFDPALTQPMPFHLADGSEMTVQMMSQEGEFAFTGNDTFGALALPYGDGRMRMVIVLPNEGVELAGVMEQLTPETWQALLDALGSRASRIVVSLPRFKMDYDERLNEALLALGMEGAFSQPDFANMVEGGGLSISYVRHKAVVEVNEEGTVAAAASAGAMTLSMPPTFTVDRPFFFAIHDSATGALLFMGEVYQPEPLEE